MENLKLNLGNCSNQIGGTGYLVLQVTGSTSSVSVSIFFEPFNAVQFQNMSHGLISELCILVIVTTLSLKQVFLGDCYCRASFSVFSFTFFSLDVIYLY